MNQACPDCKSEALPLRGTEEARHSEEMNRGSNRHYFLMGEEKQNIFWL
jgi:hypothetical protein